MKMFEKQLTKQEAYKAVLKVNVQLREAICQWYRAKGIQKKILSSAIDKLKEQKRQYERIMHS